MPKIPKTPTPHGTIGGYNNHRCRCDECRAANTRNMRRYRDEKLTGPCPTVGCERVVSRAAGTGYCYVCSDDRRAAIAS